MNHETLSHSPAHRKYSKIVIDGVDRAASRAMLFALGFTADDFAKNQMFFQKKFPVRLTPVSKLAPGSR